MAETTEVTKKLVVKDVSYGIVPYGPGCGTHAISVVFGEEEGDYTYEEPKVEKKDKTIWKTEEIAAWGLLQDVLAALKEKELGDEWSKFLLVRNYGYFVGDCLSAPEHRPVSSLFFDMVDSSALAIQLKVLKENMGGADDEKMKSAYLKQITAPSTVLVTRPLHFTGKDDFYQRFHFILCKYPLEKEYLKDNFNKMQMAIVEISNHNFATGILDFDKDVEEKMESFKTTYQNGDVFTLPEDRIFIIDHKGDDKLAEFSKESGYRLNRAMDYSGDVILKF